ncbi:MAG: hypothetical protein K1X65_07640 [Caldilineales bacterium]|nr:hypothetical protein [Caldilineales bacterium]
MTARSLLPCLYHSPPAAAKPDVCYAMLWSQRIHLATLTVHRLPCFSPDSIPAKSIEALKQ